MEFITNKNKITIPNYTIDTMNDTFTFFSKTNTKFCIQFTKHEMKEFVSDLLDKYTSKSFDELENLEDKVEDLESTLKETTSQNNELENEKDELEEEVERLNTLIKNLKENFKNAYDNMHDLFSED